MNRHIRLILIFLFVSTLTSAQTFERSIADTLCSCFSNIQATKTPEEISGLYQTDCLRKTLERHHAEVEKSLDTIPGTDAEKNLVMGNRLMTNLSRLMVSDCDPFYNFFRNYRNFFFEKADPEEEKENIVKRTESIMTNATASDYFERGLSHYLLKDFLLADLDFKKTVQLNPQHTEAHLFRGYIHEQLGKYREAISEYRIVKKAGTVHDIDLIIALAERKRREQSSSR
jgi:tetratricopeptide (TPR) repeat protein